ncbi:MAG: hypothetical protein OXD31_11995 [Chloroflexi bacterium]|nr:hypothetical protein [Chloroflexota bacterium]
MATRPDDDRQLNSTTDHDPVWEAFLNAPLDDEPFTEEDELAIKEANEDFAAGRVITHKELKRRLGL